MTTISELIEQLIEIRRQFGEIPVGDTDDRLLVIGYRITAKAFPASEFTPIGMEARALASYSKVVVIGAWE